MMAIDDGTSAPGERLWAHLHIINTMAAIALGAFLSACGSPAPTPTPAPASPAIEASAPVTSVAEDRPVVLAVGTSLTAGYGLDPDDAWPYILQGRIDAAGLPHRVVNAGVSGETSAGALRRMDWLLRQPVDVFILETGANDMLRGQDVEATRANVDAILARVRRQAPPPRLVLLGMRAAPNLGAEYVRRFASIYPEAARKHDAVLVPFVLEGVAGIQRLNQADGVHPTPEGQKIIADTVWRGLEPLLRGR
jgi:acyl-CoA thioesterase I